jgi:hypothetical protein
MQANSMGEVLYCHRCLHGRGELIQYASSQSYCAVCQSELLPLDFSQQSEKLPSIKEVLGDATASHWLCRALRGALARDPVDAANDAELLARLLAARCREILHS